MEYLLHFMPCWGILLTSVFERFGGEEVMVSVGLLSDEPIAGRGLADLIAPESDLRFVHLDCDPSELVERVASADIDVLLVDFSTRVSFGLLAKLRKRCSDCRILLWTREVSLQVAHSAYQLGLRGIVRKTVPPELLVRCFRAVADGDVWYERSVMRALQETRTVTLTRREMQLLALVGQGFTNKEIATELSLTEGTIKFYMSRLFKKMGVGDRFELALYGLKTLFHDSGTREKPAAVETCATQGPRSIVLDPYLTKSA